MRLGDAETGEVERKMEGEGRGQGLEWLKNFDVFPKTVDDAKEVSVSGGSVSVPLAYMYIMWSLHCFLASFFAMLYF